MVRIAGATVTNLLLLSPSSLLAEIGNLFIALLFYLLLLVSIWAGKMASAGNLFQLQNRINCRWFTRFLSGDLLGGERESHLAVLASVPLLFLSLAYSFLCLL